ncbi:MAG TPA: hypothetical protein VK002_12455 [Rubricoccaceae bacterium]|jgi:uncharacterized membrane protein YphA (DoxX/SURF4 family)|nr:hypothetical protein [Rubricoccaceae bacterium]
METSPSRAAARADANDMGRQAYRVLWLGFVVAPILAGLDKFLNVLVPAGWEQYLAPVVADIVPASTFMMIVGVVEVVAGIGVALKPRIFAYVVAAWLVGIILNLLLNPATFDGTGWGLDIALRDLGLALGAFALGRLSQVYGR